jgi:hypothetical protein
MCGTSVLRLPLSRIPVQVCGDAVRLSRQADGPEAGDGGAGPAV